MKKIFCLIFSLFYLIFSGCSNKNNENASAYNLDLATIEEIENIENVDAFDDETIKALSIVVRTKKKQQEKISSYTPKNKRLYNLVKETSNVVLKNKNNTAVVNFETSDIWEKHIKKYDILKYLSNKGISLANISDIETITDSNGKLTHIVIGGKTISFDELKTNFDIPTDNVIDFKINKSDVVLTGRFDENDFNLPKANTLSKQGKKYDEILKFFYNKFSLSEK